MYIIFSLLNPIILMRAKGKNNTINTPTLKIKFGIIKYTNANTINPHIILIITVE